MHLSIPIGTLADLLGAEAGVREFLLEGQQQEEWA